MQWLQGPRSAPPLQSRATEIVAPLEREMLERADLETQPPLLELSADPLPEVPTPAAPEPSTETPGTQRLVQDVRDIEERLDARFQDRLERLSSTLEQDLSERLGREVGERVGERVRRLLSEAGPDRFDGERISQSFRMLEERLLALQEELRAEREAVHARESELVAERERAEAIERAREIERLRADAAEAERTRAREETHAYRRVLAAAVANEKYALDHAAQNRREVQSRARALEEAARAKGAAEGRAQELERRVEELSAPRPLPRSSFTRAAAILAVAFLLAGVAVAQWGAALSALVARPPGGAASPSAGLHLALGTGAFALAALLWILWEREVRRFEEGHVRRPGTGATSKGRDPAT